MSSALFSASWYRVATLSPRLRSQASIHRHTYRGEVCYLVQDLSTGKFLKLDQTAYQVIALLDGNNSLTEIWQYLAKHLGDVSPTQDEIIELLSKLHQANLLITSVSPDMGEFDRRRIKQRKNTLKQYIGNPLSLKLPLFNPDRLLDLIWSPFKGRRWLIASALVLWVALMVSALGQVATHWEALTNNITAQVFTPQTVWLLWLAFPLTKLVHEIGHGVMLKAFNLRCHQIGVMFLVFMPVPYVDAGNATALPNKYQRMLVSLGGMLFELALAAVAVWLWVSSTGVLEKAFFYQIIVLAGVTTLFFNLNPLLRFDGYFVLADWLEIPNLAKKSNDYLGYWITRYVFGVPQQNRKPSVSPRERRWLVSYSIAAFTYRMFIAGAIIFLVAEQMFFIGVLLAFWAVYTMLLKPLFKQLKFLAVSPVLFGQRARAWGITISVVSVLLGVLIWVPMPYSTTAEAVVWLDEKSHVKSLQNCFGEEILVEHKQRVGVGQPLLRCNDPELFGQIQQLKAQVQEYKARIDSAELQGVESQIAHLNLQQTQVLLADAQRREQELVMRSHADGEFVMLNSDAFYGGFIQRGQPLAYVVNEQQYSLVTLIPQHKVDEVRHNTQSIELKVINDVGTTIPLNMVREAPAATNELPSLALSLAGGGEIGIDPQADPTGKAKTLEKLFLFELVTSEAHLMDVFGQRGYVRFEHHPKPIAMQLYDYIRQLFLERFAI